ncbi:MAG: glycoside hydrolase family 88 protein [Ignavibacteriae bacterium]|nr:glycoside hydrolase family 88 protein [Ignavibacteriota bacterium]
MNRILLLFRLKHISILILFSLVCISCSYSSKPTKVEILNSMTIANDYFMNKYADPGEDLIQPPSGRIWKSNIWTFGTYATGLMQLYNTNHDSRLLDYALDWGEKHNWKLSVKEMWNDHLAGQTYIDLYQLDTTKKERIEDVKSSIDAFIAVGDTQSRGFGADWNWVDASFMAMPLFAKLGAITGDDKYYKHMHALFIDMKDSIGGGLFNEEDGLWWRDADFVPPYKEPNGEDCYWARGNGWVVGALVRTLESMPDNAPNRELYESILKQMCEALYKVQRDDGMWNVSLHDPNNYGGREFSGTAFFTYGMAWGVNNGLLKADKYIPAIYRAWNTMAKECIHPNGFIGYVQSTGKEPKDGQPVTYNSVPDFEDYALGAFLLAGTEIYKMD